MSECMHCRARRISKVSRSYEEDGYLDKLIELDLYRRAVNDIEDYFEYRCESVKDRLFVFGIIDRLTQDILKLRG